MKNFIISILIISVILLFIIYNLGPISMSADSHESVTTILMWLIIALIILLLYSSKKSNS
jgi:uncharacterized membrane protein YdjX (TVP38/TMEM64 family)